MSKLVGAFLVYGGASMYKNGEAKTQLVWNTASCPVNYRWDAETEAQAGREVVSVVVGVRAAALNPMWRTGETIQVLRLTDLRGLSEEHTQVRSLDLRELGFLEPDPLPCPFDDTCCLVEVHEKGGMRKYLRAERNGMYRTIYSDASGEVFNDWDDVRRKFAPRNVTFSKASRLEFK